MSVNAYQDEDYEFIRKRKFLERKINFVTGNFEFVSFYTQTVKGKSPVKIKYKVIERREFTQSADIEIQQFVEYLNRNKNTVSTSLPRQKRHLHDIENLLFQYTLTKILTDGTTIFIALKLSMVRFIP